MSESRVTLSRTEIEAGKSPRGGFTRTQLAEWGVPWPPPKGWKRKLEGRGTGTGRTGTVVRKDYSADVLRDLRSAVQNIDTVLEEQVGDLHSTLRTARDQVLGVICCMEGES